MQMTLWMALLLSFFAPQVEGQSLFWENEFSTALAERSRFFRNYEIERESPQFGKWQKAEINLIEKKIAKKNDFDNLWFNFTRGLLDHRQGKGNAALFFGNSLSLAKSSPGDLWLLFMEFHDQGIYQWEDASLEALHRLMILRNAEAVPLVAQQLLSLAYRDGQVSENLIAWAARFDYKVKQGSLQKLKEGVSGDLSSLIGGLRELIGFLQRSWSMQVSTLYYGIGWLRSALVVLVLAVLLFLSLRHFSLAIRPFYVVLPKSLSDKTKNLLMLGFLFLFFLGGFFPLAWALVFLFWRVCERSEKKLLLVVVALLCLAPIDAWLRGSFYTPIEGRHALSLYSQAIQEGYNADLKLEIEESIKVDNENFLTHLSLAVLMAKKGDYDQALKSGFSAEFLAEDVAVVKVVLGNIHQFRGELDKAVEYYRKALKIEPQEPHALFNLSQVYQSEVRAPSGFGRTSNEKNQNPRIRHFLLANEDHFASLLPLGRQVIMPEINAGFFWKQMYWAYGFDQKTAERLWGNQFFGLSSWASMGVFGLLLGFLVYKHKTKWHRKPLWALEILERQAKEKENQRERLREMMGNFMSHRYRVHLINMLFPGLGYLYQSRSFKLGVGVLLMLSSLFYSLYGILFYWSFYYPLWHEYSLFAFVLLFPLAYNLYFLVRGAYHLYLDQNYKEALDGV